MSTPVPLLPALLYRARRDHTGWRQIHARFWLVLAIALFLAASVLTRARIRPGGLPESDVLPLPGGALVLEHRPVSFTQQVEVRVRLATAQQPQTAGVGLRHVLPEVGPGWFVRLSLHGHDEQGPALAVLTVVTRDPVAAVQRLWSQAWQWLKGEGRD